MIFDKVGNTTIVFQEGVALSTFLENLNKAYSEIKNDHLIINLFSLEKITNSDVLEFFELSNTHKATNKSFVLVTDKVSYNELPDDILVVPTIKEAHDIIEMEEMERDLGL